MQLIQYFQEFKAGMSVLIFMKHLEIEAYEY